MASLNPALLPESGVRENVAPGWRRVVRARDAAYARPHTEHAKLFFARRDLASLFPNTDVHVRAWRAWNGDAEFYVCSDFCAVFHRQVGRTRVQSYGEARQEILYGKSWINNPVRTRKFTCFVCRRVVNKSGGVDTSTERVNLFDPRQEIKNVPKIPRAKFTKPWTPMHVDILDEEPRVIPALKKLADEQRAFTPGPTSTVTITVAQYEEYKELLAQKDSIRKFLGL